jgi:cation diffusion facilitator CzcD-associated flavoprotein CzcO
MVSQDDEIDFAGPAVLTAGEDSYDVRVYLSGRVEPVDGRYHWGGRIAADDAVAQLVRDGRRAVTLRTADGGGSAVPVRLGEVDAWGGIGVRATGTPPWAGADGPAAVADPSNVDTPTPSNVDKTSPSNVDGARDAIVATDVAIVGAGFGGLGAAIRLKQRGRDDFLVFEQAHDIGGTWRDNTYPGCACDVPSHLYSFSFALNPAWTDTFSGQPEIWAYLKATAVRFGVTPHLRFGHELLGADWDDSAGRWRLSTSHGEYSARVLVIATGPLSQPSTPDIPGLESFAGTTFHSARWRHDVDLSGARVAVIGTGASAIQFVPEIAPVAGALTLFQRTAPWVLPRASRRITGFEHAVYRWVPGAQRLARGGLYWARELFALGFLHPRVNRLASRVGSGHLRRQVRDPVLRAKLTPTFVMGCKRVLLSNDYYPALTRDNVTVVTESIREVRPHGVVTADGVEHPADTIILGTGFHVTDPPMAGLIRGRDGRSLAQVWQPTMRAHRGTTVSGFPNLFILLGPNTGLGHTSVVLMVETQIRYLLAALDHQRRAGVAYMEPTEQAQARDAAEVDARMASTVWMTGGCRSWYLDATGRNSTLWPGYATAYRLRLRKFRAGDYVTVTPRREPAAVPVGASS